MEVKKSPKADLEGRKSTWLLVAAINPNLPVSASTEEFLKLLPPEVLS